jgi:transcriptional activator of cad operon
MPLKSEFLVGDFRVDPALDEISREGVTTKLEPRTMRVLVCLAEHAGQVVSVEQLLNLVWKDVVVSTDSVYQAVASLRRILGDDPKDPKYIVNVMRRGYRLIAAVSPWTDIVSPLPKTVFRSSRTNQRILIVGLTCLALISGGFGAWLELHRIGRQGASDSLGGQTVAPAEPLSIAVLPFDESTTESYDLELAQALAETVRQRLGMSEKLIVKARGSSVAVAGQQADTKTMARRLAARYLLKGAVERKKDRLHVTAQLLDAETGSILQSFSVDRQTTDIFELQNEIAVQISNAISKQLIGPGRLREPRTRSTSLDAYLKFLDAQALLRHVTVDDAEQAAVTLEQVTKMDPAFALPYAELARARWMAKALNAQPIDRNAILPLIEKALSLDPTLGEAYLMRAMLESDDHKVEEADLRKGVDLAPNFAPGYELYAIASNDNFDNLHNALAMIERAILLDPLAAEYVVQKGIYVLTDTHSQALADKLYAQAQALDPDFSRVNRLLAMIEWRKGETAHGIKLIERALHAEKKENFIHVAACAMYLDIGDRQAARSVAAGLPANSEANIILAAYDSDFQKAAARDDPEMSFEVSEFAYWISLDAAARRSGAIAKVISRLRKEFPLGNVKDGTAPNSEYDAALTVTGALLHAQGDRAGVVQVLPALKDLLDKNESRTGWGHSYLRLLSGDPDGALALLAIDIRRQHSLEWWILERDPLWADLRSDARFRDIVGFAREQAAQQREILERMRQQGEVPRRGATNIAGEASGSERTARTRGEALR